MKIYLEMEMKDRTLDLFKKSIQQAKIMLQKYDVLITNPPYIGNRYLTPELPNYLKKHYPDVKSDLFSAFIEYSFHATKYQWANGLYDAICLDVYFILRKIKKKPHQQIRNISSLDPIGVFRI